MKNKETKAALYLRAPAEKVANRGECLAMQEEMCTERCDVHDIKVDSRHIYIDVAHDNSTLKKRPGLKALLKAAKRGKFDVVAVSSLERFGHGTRFALDIVHELQSIDVGIISATENLDLHTAYGKSALMIMAALAEHELIRSRS